MKILMIDGTTNSSLSEIDGKKIILAEEIVKFFTPLFNEEIDRKKKQLDRNKQDYLKLKKSIDETDSRIQTLNVEIRRERLIFSILKEIKCLSDHDILYGNNRQIVSDVLSSLGVFTEDQLAACVEQLRKMVHRNVKKIIM